MRLGWILAAAAFVAPAPNETVQSDGFRRHVFCLEYHRDFTRWGVPNTINRSATFFLEEPSFDGRPVHRRILAHNPDTHQAFGFAWDAQFNMLFVDLNGNQDLTDDPAGVFPDCHEPGRFGGAIEFQLPFETGPMPYHLEPGLTLRRGSLYVAPLMRSGWTGRVELRGRSWEMAYMDDMDGRISAHDGLLLRRASETRNSFDPRDDQALELGTARRLFLEGVFYDVDLTFEHSRSAPLLNVVFTERRDWPMGELLITGSSVRRIVLGDLRDRSDASVIVLDDPGPCVPVPVGTYANPVVQLDPGESLGACAARLQGAVVIKEGRQTELAAGAPLRHAVSVDSHQGTLTVRSRLLGLGGESYHLTDRRNGRLQLPIAAIGCRGAKAASGAMRYGLGGAYSYSWRVPFSAYGPVEVRVSRDTGAIPVAESPPTAHIWTPRDQAVSALYSGIMKLSPWLGGILAPGLAMLVLLRLRQCRRREVRPVPAMAEAMRGAHGVREPGGQAAPTRGRPSPQEAARTTGAW